ncbi:sigma-70 family RNA polymerase sigma factor [Clostridium disporicum]|uniref:sigma-70 family RNA polymerase sigma factor n=1 Tax=Clostridium disporicum TaxID=84024 RepID=UPI003BFA6E65
MEALHLAKSNDTKAILEIIEKYTSLVNKYSYIYNLKNYDNDDLKQEGNLAILKAIKKFDTSKNNSYFDAYVINSIKNQYGDLTRRQARYKDESSLNILSSDDSNEIIDLIEGNTNIEEDFIKKLDNSDRESR